MKTAIGVWIDHRKAIIVSISDAGDKIQHILSHVEKQQGRIEGVRSTAHFESQMVQADDRQQRGFSKHLKSYFNEVISHIGDAESVLVFGPGEAKGELRKLLEQTNHHDRMVMVESADKMTDGQIAARVRQYASENVAQVR